MVRWIRAEVYFRSRGVSHVSLQEKKSPCRPYKNMSFENISNLYKELGYDSTHHCDIVAGSLYKITSSLKFSLVSVVGGLGTPWDPELAESLLLPY